MRTLVLDTSVAIAWYLPEVFASASRSVSARIIVSPGISGIDLRSAVTADISGL